MVASLTVYQYVLTCTKLPVDPFTCLSNYPLVYMVIGNGTLSSSVCKSDEQYYCDHFENKAISMCMGKIMVRYETKAGKQIT